MQKTDQSSFLEKLIDHCQQKKGYLLVFFLLDFLDIFGIFLEKRKNKEQRVLVKEQILDLLLYVINCFPQVFD